MPDKEQTNSASESENPVIPAPTTEDSGPAEDKQGLVAESAGPLRAPPPFASLQSDGGGV